MLEDNKRKKEGYIKEFDNYYGTIVTLSDREYEFVYRDIETPGIAVGDEVEFFADDKYFEGHPIYIARYIRKKEKVMRR